MTLQFSHDCPHVNWAEALGKADFVCLGSAQLVAATDIHRPYRLPCVAVIEICQWVCNHYRLGVAISPPLLSLITQETGEGAPVSLMALGRLAVLQAVGVMGDGLTYNFVCASWAVTSTDNMTVDYFHFDHEFLSLNATRIINEVRGINRVVYDIMSKPPGTIEWENVYRYLGGTKKLRVAK